MTVEQILIAVWAAPATSLIILLFGIYLQNVNMNALRAELKGDMNVLRNELNQRITTESAALREVLRAELAAIRAEMAKNHSELLMRLIEHENRRH